MTRITRELYHSGDLAISDIVRMIHPKVGLFQHEYELEPN